MRVDDKPVHDGYMLVNMIAHLVEHCTGIAGVQVPSRSFSGATTQVALITAKNFKAAFDVHTTAIYVELTSVY